MQNVLGKPVSLHGIMVSGFGFSDRLSTGGFHFLRSDLERDVAFLLHRDV